VGGATIDIRFWREGAATRHDVLAIDGELNVESVLTPIHSRNLPTS
jgi:hypothetical protein